MKHIIKKLCVLLLMATAVPGYAVDCVMHIRTKAGKTVEVTVSEGDFYGAQWWDESENNLECHFMAYTGIYVIGEDGKPSFVDPSGDVRGVMLCDMLMNDIEEITFSGISDVKDLDSDSVDIRLCDGILRISRVTEPVQVTVTDISGILEYNGVVKEDTEIDLKEFGGGIHAVKAGNVTFKTVIR